MSTTLERYDIACSGFLSRLEVMDASDARRPTPCEDWTVDDLVDHTIGAVVAVGNLVGEPVSDDPDAAPLPRFVTASEALRAKIVDPALSGQVVDTPFGTLALKQLVSSIVVHDLVVHTWDLSRAIGADEQLDEDLVGETYAQMLPLDELLRDGHGFGTKVEPPADADVQTRLLCFLGRCP
jgi:uncharacterized protein (TIGR03086 family)